MDNPIDVRPEDYQADKDYFISAVRQTAEYLVRMTGCTFDEAHNFIVEKQKDQTPSNKFRHIDPKVKLLVRDRETQDRHVEVDTLSNYFNRRKQENLITSPAWTSYYNHKERRSVTGKYIVKKMDVRNVAKKLMFEMTMLKNKTKAVFYKFIQSSAKFLNNSLSGASSSQGNIFFCPSIHPSLTSGCRAGTGVANAHNEKFIGGHRYFPNHHWVIAALLHHMTVCDKERVAKVMETYQLVYPTAEQVREVIAFSYKRYTRDDAKRFDQLIGSMTKEERAYFVYSGDLYHLHVYNPEFTVNFLKKLSNRPSTSNPADVAEYDSIHGDIKLHASVLCADLITGRQVKTVREENPETFELIASTAVYLTSLLTDYAELIKLFWYTECAPMGASFVPYYARRVVPLSDTDSTVFTNQHWTKTVRGKDKVDFSMESTSINSAVTFLTCQITRHWLFQFTANCGIPEDFRYSIGMKNEFTSPLLALTLASKHYAMYSTIQEGNILPERKLEIKGVSMRNSKWPTEIKRRHEKWITDTFDTIMADGGISIHTFLKVPYEMEKDIFSAIGRGEAGLYNRESVKTEDVYKNAESSNFAYHALWNATFGKVYGMAAEPPYRGTAVPVQLGKPAAIKAWVSSIENPVLKQSLETYFAQHKRASWSFIIIPDTYSLEMIPKEIIPIVDARRVISTTLKGFYMVMSAFGIELGDKNNAIFLTDVYTPPSDETA